jgi:hypothetical protein
MHPDLKGVVDEKQMFKLAKKVGLDKIDYGKTYQLKKLRSKDHAKNSYETGYWTRGYPCLIGDGKKNVALFVNGMQDWFKTSAILKVTPTEKGFELETLNSFYALERT